jgi:trans-2,3-dihydro-3-hydroxyanthranilate isomerase
MPSFPFMQVDAFTNRPLSGNPCAVIFESDSLDVETMQAIARENNLSETAFVLRSSVADVRARYFTPATEIPMAGHPTIATIWALIDSGRFSLAETHTHITLELQVGVIPIDIYSERGEVKRITMSQKTPEFLRTYTAEEIAPLFGLSVDDILPDVPVQTVSTGTPQLMIPLRSLEALRRVTPNLAAYGDFLEQVDFYSPHLFCLQGATADGRTFARHFGLPPDTFEDPFTGSATGGMAAYLWHYRLIQDPSFVAEQGHWMQRPGQAYVTVVGTPDEITTVQVGGQAITVMRGEMVI